MGTLSTPDGYVNPEWQELARKLTQGDGLNWQGDPALYLGLGVIEEQTRTGRKTGRRGHRLEVWKFTELGEHVMIGHWHPSESWRIIYDLCQMDPRSRGFVPLADRLDKADAEMEKEQDEAAHENMMEAMSHAAWVHVKKHEPGWKFTGMPGRKEPAAPEAKPSLDGVR